MTPNSDPDLQSNVIIQQVGQELRSDFFFLISRNFPWSFGSPYSTMFWEKSLQGYYCKYRQPRVLGTRGLAVHTEISGVVLKSIA